MTEPVIPSAPDGSDVGWGDAVGTDDDEAVRRLLDERPPHHDR